MAGEVRHISIFDSLFALIQLRILRQNPHPLCRHSWRTSEL
jgi:hypothetical protein